MQINEVITWINNKQESSTRALTAHNSPFDNYSKGAFFLVDVGWPRNNIIIEASHWTNVSGEGLQVLIGNAKVQEFLESMLA